MKKDIEVLFSTIIELSKAIAHHSSQSLEEKHSTMLQFLVLSFIKGLPNCTMSELAKSLKISVSSATQIVERLAKSNFVERIPDKKDRRIIRINLTSKGKIEYKRMKGEIFSEMEKIFSKISNKDRKTLIRIHTNLLNSLKTDNI